MPCSYTADEQVLQSEQENCTLKHMFRQIDQITNFARISQMVCILLALVRWLAQVQIVLLLALFVVLLISPFLSSFLLSLSLLIFAASL